MFTKLLTCGECGSNITFRNKGAPPKGGKYLRCSKSEISTLCTSPAWKYEEFEETFFQFITEIDLNDIIDEKNNKEEIKKLHDMSDILSDEIRRMHSAHQLILNKLSNVDSATVDDILHQLSTDKQITIDKEKSEIDKKISEILDKPICSGLFIIVDLDCMIKMIK